MILDGRKDRFTGNALFLEVLPGHCLIYDRPWQVVQQERQEQFSVLHVSLSTALSWIPFEVFWVAKQLSLIINCLPDRWPWDLLLSLICQTGQDCTDCFHAVEGCRFHEF